MKMHSSYLILLVSIPFFLGCDSPQVFEGVWIPREGQQKDSSEMEFVIEKVNDLTYDIQMISDGVKENRTNLSASGTYTYDKKTRQIIKSSSSVIMEITNDGELYTQGLIGVQFFIRQ